MSSQIRNVAIIAGGTGGHISPGVALLESIQDHKDKLGIESVYIHSLNRNKDNPDLNSGNFEVIWHDLRQFSWKSFPLFVYSFIISFLNTILDFKKRKITSIICMGGYSTIPAILYAILFKKEIFLCEQNIEPGWMTLKFAKFANKIAFSFPVKNPKYIFKNSKVLGNPIRKKLIPDKQVLGIKSQHQSLNPKKAKINVLVLGGSQGARQINEMVLKVMEVTAITEHYQFRMITGTNLYEETKVKTKLGTELISYTEDMKTHYEWSNIIIARSGAGVISEASLFALPMILIPYPYAASDHQSYNANYFLENHSAFVINQLDSSPDQLISILEKIIKEPELLQMMAISSFSLSRINASYDTLRYFFHEE
jgi:UDP-N-acetylglucosamine--N-acetylmuramyl-(pentapeptide) pyrophosphoryl-undecaprenol N-acetylglucosamine transferase